MPIPHTLASGVIISNINHCKTTHLRKTVKRYILTGENTKYKGFYQMSFKVAQNEPI